MKAFNYLFFAAALVASSVCYAWEIQQSRICSGVGLHAEKYTLCFPDDFSIDVINERRVGLVSDHGKPSISFKFRSYANLLAVDQEGGEMKFKTKTNIDGEIVYMHHFPFPGSDITTYTWTVVIEEGELYMQLIGKSEQEISALFAEIMSSKKIY